MKTVFGFIISAILVIILIWNSYGAEIVIENDYVDTSQELFDNVVIVDEAFTNDSEIKEILYIIDDTILYDINNVEYPISKGEKVIVVERQPRFTKVIFNERYYFVLTELIGYEDAIEKDVVYPVSSEIPLPVELQNYIYDKCVENNIKYCLFLGLCQQESDFGRYKARNGVQFHVVSSWGDYGMCQTNKKYVWPDVKKVFGWNDITILFNPYRSVDAGIWEFSKCVNKYGNTEAAYDAYNRGLEHGGSTANSRKVVAYWNNWKKVFGDI